ncbi:uncharacterized protein LOC117031601 [Rhinolophus ferrumequinum]|uniref:uncharacterized protein LOC117031601 n=1 Tax=Rhinolophus ferrumequinum TaxID=59479 RepID=UPI00140F793A|nr:uncharacterized protein LOC117031601 [Rhinolophus ferrumequinum]
MGSLHWLLSDAGAPGPANAEYRGATLHLASSLEPGPSLSEAGTALSWAGMLGSRCSWGTKAHGKVPVSPCPFVSVPVSPYHPGLPVLSRELPSEGPHGLCRVGAGTRDRTCSPFSPDGSLIPSLSPQLRSLTPSLYRRPTVLPPPETLQAAPPCLGGIRKAQRCIFISSRTALPHLVALSVQPLLTWSAHSRDLMDVPVLTGSFHFAQCPQAIHVMAGIWTS